jgi:hypothetical protein
MKTDWEPNKQLSNSRTQKRKYHTIQRLITKTVKYCIINNDSQLQNSTVERCHDLWDLMMDRNFIAAKIGTSLMGYLEPEDYFDSEHCSATVPLSGTHNHSN